MFLTFLYVIVSVLCLILAINIILDIIILKNTKYLRKYKSSKLISLKCKKCKRNVVKLIIKYYNERCVHSLEVFDTS